MNAPTSSADQTQHFINLLKKFRTVMLVTHTAGNDIHSRPMAIAEIEDNGRLWFISGADTAKVHEIEMDSHVHLIAQNDNDAYVTFSGRASLVADRAKIAELWQERFRVWFPRGQDDPAIELITVLPERGEFWDNTGTRRFKYFWEAAKAYMSGTTPDANDPQMHGTVQM
jgi:general stress protein 26